jgi:hypothetical protein
MRGKTRQQAQQRAGALIACANVTTHRIQKGKKNLFLFLFFYFFSLFSRP